MRVLARAYGDEPVDREIAGTFDGGYFLINPSAPNAKIDELSGVGFPSAYVFKFDADLYQRISEALVRGDANEVCALWNQAAPLN